MVAEPFSSALDANGDAAEPDGEGRAARGETADFMLFLLKLALVALIARTFFLSAFTIPSESMQPRLLIGDFLLVNKAAYGYSRHSMPFGLPLVPGGRVLARSPARGDVVVFKAPPGNTADYIKRVIGLPGDTVQVSGGQVILNGTPVPRRRIADFVIPVTPNMIEASRAEGTLPCFSMEFEEVATGGQRQCRYPRYVETLPGGPSFETLDLIRQVKDDTPPVVVPAGHLFLMGDNLDRSADSRFEAVEGAGIGLVPEENLVGKAMVGVFSTDGSASWLNPVSWFTAARWDRVGDGF